MSFPDIAADHVTPRIAPERPGEIRVIDVKFAINDGDGHTLPPIPARRVGIDQSQGIGWCLRASGTRSSTTTTGGESQAADGQQGRDCQSRWRQRRRPVRAVHAAPVCVRFHDIQPSPGTIKFSPGRPSHFGDDKVGGGHTRPLDAMPIIGARSRGLSGERPAGTGWDR
jgi:hypothetical protein